jgi:uncharacterized protein
MTTLSIAGIERLTLKYGENWALAHVRRLLKLIEQIGAGMEYDRQVILWATYLHDWGAFPRYYQPGCDHALLSRQIAETEILPQTDLPAEVKAKILETIELHDYRDQRPAGSAEGLLLREADFLDFLGAIGIAREFAKGPKNIQKSYQQLLKRREEIKHRFTIPQAVRIAEERLARMEAFFENLLEESFGYL